MLHRVIFGLLIIVWSVANPWCTVPAHAALGGDLDSIRADANALGGSLNNIQRPNYSDYRITSEGAGSVSEFIDAAGTVFAVAWSGPAPPQLERLLGAYYPDYLHAWSTLPRPGLRRSVRVTGSKVVVEIGGHLRAYAGFAYLPASMPPGVAATDLMR
jgi:hypothetical protein